MAASYANIVIVKPKGYEHSEAFAELAETLRWGLEGLKLCARVTRNHFDPAGVNIVLGWHLLNKAQRHALPARCILYNLEQMDDKNHALRGRLKHLARRSEVWDYSLRNIEILHQSGFPATLRHVPIGSMPALGRILSAPDQDIEVLFYGSINARRAKVIEELKAAGLNVHAVFGVYGAQRDALIARAKVVLNLHYYDASIFEMVRTSYLWINRKAVVAECHEATEVEADLKEAASFVPYHQLLNACRELVACEPARRALEQRAFAVMSARDEVSILRRVMEVGAEVQPRCETEERDPSSVTREPSSVAIAHAPVVSDGAAAATQASVPVQLARFRVAVITPSLPERQQLLDECRASVCGQTLPPEQHQVGMDFERSGPAAVRNRLVACLPEAIDWIAFLDDDDLLLPGHLERLASAAESSDIVYSRCRVEGGEVPWSVHAFDPLALHHDNYIPVTVLMRRRLFERLGGFRALERDEDWDLWKRAWAAGARFRFVDEITWIYRLRVDGRTFGASGLMTPAFPVKHSQGELRQ